MADLHRFQDNTTTPEGRRKPIKAQHLDENFTYCRLKVVGPISSFLKIVENAPKNDELQFAFDIPSSGTYVMGFVDGVFSLLETEDC